MSLRFALLGLLAERPASGYDLTKRFEQGIGAFAWSARHSQIYPELTKLTEEGLVEVIAEGGRGRKVYDVTGAGRASLRTWLLDGQRDTGTVRNEFVLRLFLLSTLEPDDRLQVLDGVQAFAEGQLGVLDGERTAMAAAGSPPASGPDLAAMFGIFSYRATRDWARWAADAIRAAT